MRSAISLRELERHELSDIWSIDRAELTERVYSLEKGVLVLKPAHFDLKGWPPGSRENYAPVLLDCFDHGGTFYGAFDGATLAGVSVLESRFIGRDADQLQLTFMHVSRSHRHAGVGRTLFQRAVARARELGARRIYVSATPSENTIRFYLRQGCRIAKEVDPALFALEPEDIHLELEIPV